MSSDALSLAYKFVVGECPESVRLNSLVTIRRVVARYEIVEVRSDESTSLQGKALIGAEVVDP